jgi:hypothetical protein
MNKIKEFEFITKVYAELADFFNMDLKSGIKQKAEYFMSHKASVKRRKKNRKK